MACQAFVLIVLPGRGRVGVSRRQDNHLLFLVLNTGPKGIGILSISRKVLKRAQQNVIMKDCSQVTLTDLL